MAGALLPLFVLSLTTGSTHVPLSTWWNGSFTDIERIIVLESRLPRAVAALLGGGALALSGLLMQTLFRNPLAGPSVLGLSSGASLAVAAVTLTAGSAVLAQWSVVLAAIAGAGAVLVLILIAARRFADVTAVLIVGLMLGFFASALVSLLQSMADEVALQAYVFWGFGTFGNVSRHALPYFAIPLVVIAIVSPIWIKPLNSLLPGEAHAQTMGVNTRRLRIALMVATGILVGTVTAFCGPIAFIGLAAPHLARFVFRTVNHRIILPFSWIMGGVLGLGCDLIARLPGLDAALPLNTVTAFMGAPVVIYLILSGRKRTIAI